ncbi:glycoside hydrolase family 2 protein [Vararia minispora EC-137]|uniref:Glycoside hydrolase family 2 protein n=1 Tax=Vararia minispora EC-137 TaxID=1314806 RepID=A0ACB8QWW2_9AGAM|nr:glycoside hydrolase family 2 protein [Vararia minispora EC-137]
MSENASVVRLLHENWLFTQIGGGDGTLKDEWLPTTSFPTSVHVELLKAKRIPDPFIGLHEWDVQWIGEAEWAFKTTFAVTEMELAAENVDLVFDGLDTFASVALNGQTILQTQNQFVSYRASAKSFLKRSDNELVITFASAFTKGRDLEHEYGKMQLWNGDSGRLHVRKAQYTWGWDWGPVLVTVGPWKPISLHTYASTITDLRVSSDVAEDHTVTVDITFSVSSPAHVVTSVVSILGADGTAICSENMASIGGPNIRLTFPPGEVCLWYPIGYGKQTMYTVKVVTYDQSGKQLDEKKQQVGFRRARVVEEKLSEDGHDGLTFLFEVNNVRIFCGGSNWIPADSFLTTVTPERYRAWLELLVKGNQNMVRVWGGGIYENDVFYDICDELGILVWQDFMFGCGQYPAYDALLKNVEVEAEQAVKRLRHHPSIVIFAGNNEDYMFSEMNGNIPLPAKVIYEEILPNAVAKFSNVHYHRSSPYSGNGKTSNDVQYGDTHQWNVWHGTQEPWHNWDKLAARFCSEFGMQAYPNIRTVDYWTGSDKAERYPQSRTTINHDKAEGSERRLELYLMENFKHAFDMESYVYYTQIMQAETLSAAYRLWRRNWKGKGKEYTAGALVWQINDCWPCTSWAIVDYFLRPKPAFFSIARELARFTIGIARTEQTMYPDRRRAALLEVRSKLGIWGTNSTLSDKNVVLLLQAFNLNDPEWKYEEKKNAVLEANKSTELWEGDVPGQEVRAKKSEAPKPIVVSARLLDADGSVLARYSNWPEPFKYIHFPPVEELGLSITVAEDGASVELSTKRPIKGIILEVDGSEDVKWSDQAIDLVPGDNQVVRAEGIKGRVVKARFLGDGTA